MMLQFLNPDANHVIIKYQVKEKDQSSATFATLSIIQIVMMKQEC